MKPVKVVYNACFGGFSLSRKAAERLVQLGVTEMEQTIKDRDSDPHRLFGDHYSTDLARHDPRLVQVVEEFGREASGPFAELEVVELKGNKYILDEYDGSESVNEPDDINWIVVEQ